MVHFRVKKYKNVDITVFEVVFEVVSEVVHRVVGKVPHSD